MYSVLSLLEKISSRQIHDLIQEQQLIADGYKFYYTIDNRDLHKYCFPGNLLGDDFELDENGNINYDLETDILTAYEEFFKHVSYDHPVFLFADYLPEVKGLRDQIVMFSNKARLFNYADTFLKYLENFDQDSIPEDFTLFIAIATGILKDGISRFNNLLSNNAFIVGDELTSDVGNQELLEEALSYRQDDPFSDVSKNVEEIFFRRVPTSRRFSKRIDSDVILRIVGINQMLLKKYDTQKVLFLYLSSTKYSGEVVREIEPYLPKIKGITFNFHRTVEQLFLKRLFQDLPIALRIERLKEAEKLARYREENQRIMESESESLNDLRNSIIISYKELREMYVNVNLARTAQFEEVSTLFNELTSLKEGAIRYNKVKSLYGKLKALAQKHGDRKVNLADVKELENAIEVRQIFTIIFKRSFTRLLEGKPIQLRRGSDAIMGVGQHLPVVFCYKDNPADTLLDEIGDLFIEQSFFNSNMVNANALVQNKLLKVNDPYVDRTFVARTPKEKLLYALYLLILPDASDDLTKSNSLYVEHFLLDIYRKGMHDMDDVLAADFLYSLAWVLRRNERYEEALEVTHKGREDYPGDPRFLHSSFLINACLAGKGTSREQRREMFRDFLEDIRQTKQLYEPFLQHKGELIRRNINGALLNSEIYASVCLLSLSDTPIDDRLDRLRELRENGLMNLKRIMKDKYFEYPEFLHTEATLEFQESEYALEERIRADKLDYAIVSLNRAISIGKLLGGFRVDQYEDLLETLNNKKNQLERVG